VLLSKRAAAKYLEVSRMRIYELLASGSLPNLHVATLEKWREEHADARLRYRGLLPLSALRKKKRYPRRVKAAVLRTALEPAERLLQYALVRQARHAGLTLQAIATEMGLTRERIRQICL